MNINGYKKNKYYYFNHHNNICSNNLNSNNCCENKFNCNLNCLFEVEHFLCNLKKICKCINLYKFLK